MSLSSTIVLRPTNATPAPPPPPLLLLVDDAPVDRHVAGRIVESFGWETAFAGNAREALSAVALNPPRLVLTDLQMPEMDGLALVERMREKYPLIPVVLMTAMGSEDVAIRALKAGAAHYVPKKHLKSARPVLEQVLAASQGDAQRRRMLGSLLRRESDFSLENDPDLVAPLVALLQEDLLTLRICDAADATRVGIALQEALLNGMYHGNLEISTDQRALDSLTELARQRRQAPPYCERRLSLLARVTPAEAVYIVTDQGPGFDPATLPDPLDLANLVRPHGRGQMLMRIFMDEVKYASSGNRVTLIKRARANP